MVLPEPGGAISMMLCPPAVATSMARLAWYWPLTSPKEGRTRTGLGVSILTERRHFESA
jgi:hypothetical protein